MLVLNSFHVREVEREAYRRTRGRLAPSQDSGAGSLVAAGDTALGRLRAMAALLGRMAFCEIICSMCVVGYVAEQLQSMLLLADSRVYSNRQTKMRGMISDL
jgi:hypothetical protein